MQPYFLPYLGYFQLIAAVDCFVVYDNVQFIKNGWIERNRYLLNAEPKWFGVALAKGSHTQHIMHKQISTQFAAGDVMNKLAFAYRRAPFRDSMLTWLTPLLNEPAESIAVLNERLLRACCQLIGLQTPLIKASDLLPRSHCTSQDRVIELIQACGASHYLNTIGGQALYTAEAFADAGITLEFLHPQLSPYAQGRVDAFTPGLSILDALMYNAPEQVGELARQGEINRA